MRAAPRKHEQGFTMIEVMVSLLLTAIAAVGIIALFLAETKSSSVSRHSTEASVLAADKLEKLRTLDVPANGTDSVDAAGNPAGTFLFTREWTVTDAGTYKDITVEVSWVEDGFPRSVIMLGKQMEYE